MEKAKQTEYKPVDFSPVKSFFVSMLTRDILLEDAILDLLDNCVDGILRSGKTGGEKPYTGFSAAIDFKKESFSITDNCGGIPWTLHDYAFKLGRATKSDRPVDPAGTVGAYGIGMKRAIFKMGKHCLISTRSGQDQYEIEITPDWLDTEDKWQIPVKKVKKHDKDGTTIVIGELHEGISKKFSEDADDFTRELRGKIAGHYSFIIDKGFEVSVNGKPISPLTTKFAFLKGKDENTIRPYVFKTKSDGVDIFLTVGFTRGIPTPAEILDEEKSPKYSSQEAGWTIICNDRAVLYNDRSILTGWGDSGVPQYHTQFIAISGIVEFKSADASKLPTTTTKRGIDASSALYQQVKNKMREGMRIFTDFTNKWKGKEEEAKALIQQGERLSFEKIKEEAKNLHFHRTLRTFPSGDLYQPKLAMPVKPEPTSRRISFTKEMAKIRTVGEYFGNRDMAPNGVGEKCFDKIYEEASRK
ncbi:MAG: ATP-binding protein [Dehalococcoidales bacterium]|jgi:hypothetical protein